MNYNFTPLTSRDDCQALVGQVTKEKDDLIYRLMGLRRRHSNGTGASQALDAEIVSTQSLLNVLDSIIPGLPEGAFKNNKIDEREDLQYRLTKLIRQREKKGVVAEVSLEFDIGIIEGQINETDAFLAAINAHMNSIPE